MVINVCDRCGRQFSDDAEVVFGKMLCEVCQSQLSKWLEKQHNNFCICDDCIHDDVCGEEGHRDGGMTHCRHKIISN
jgi:hypothetical protein